MMIFSVEFKLFSSPNNFQKKPKAGIRNVSHMDTRARESSGDSSYQSDCFCSVRIIAGNFGTELSARFGWPVLKTLREHRDLQIYLWPVPLLGMISPR